MPCSFCLENGHKITNCPNILQEYKEDYLETITFEDFVIKMLLYKYCSNLLKIKNRNISSNFKYLFNRYINTTKTHYMADRDVLKLHIQKYTETRDSFDNYDEDTHKETIYIMLPYQFDKEYIDLEKIKTNCVININDILENTEYSITQIEYV
jgi:hypothetical protein